MAWLAMSARMINPNGVQFNLKNVDDFRTPDIYDKPVIYSIKSKMDNWAHAPEPGIWIGCFEVKFRIQNKLQLIEASQGMKFTNKGCSEYSDYIRGADSNIIQYKRQITLGETKSGEKWIDWRTATPLSMRRDSAGWIEVVYGFRIERNKADFDQKMIGELNAALEYMNDKSSKMLFQPFSSKAEMIHINPSLVLRAVLDWLEGGEYE